MREHSRSSGEQITRHRRLPALLDVTQAVGTASRFCGFASLADSTPFGEACDLRTQQSMRRSGAPGLQLRSDCVGTQLWAYAIADLVLSVRDQPQPPVSFCLPGSIPHGEGQCDLDITLADLREKISRRVRELRDELQRRNFVRVNTECGELALGHHRATEALGHFERAFTKAKDAAILPRALRVPSMGASLMGSMTQTQPEPEPEAADDVDEQAQLQDCIARSTKEKQRQEYVKDLHDKATAALAQKGQKGEKAARYTAGGAQFAIARYLEAIKSENSTEHGNDSSELTSLNLMHKFAQLWKKGDDAMIAWDGRTAEKHYKEAQEQSKKVSRDLQFPEFRPTQGFAGHKIQLCEPATNELKACIQRAQAEIRRKDDFNDKIQTAEEHLVARRAESSKATFEAADEVSTHPAEMKKADDGIKRAEEERKRQSDAKEPVSQAMGLIARCRPTVWTQDVPGARPQPAEWQQAAVEAQTAIDKCSEGLRHMELDNGSLQSQMGTQEHIALRFLREACEHWKKGDEHKAEWKGENALTGFEAAKDHANKARDTGATPGYLGDPCHMTLDAASSLQECIGVRTMRLVALAIWTPTRRQLAQTSPEAQQELQKRCTRNCWKRLKQTQRSRSSQSYWTKRPEKRLASCVFTSCTSKAYDTSRQMSLRRRLAITKQH